MGGCPADMGEGHSFVKRRSRRFQSGAGIYLAGVFRSFGYAVCVGGIFGLPAQHEFDVQPTSVEEIQ